MGFSVQPRASAAAILLGENPWYTLNRRLVEQQHQFVCFGEQRNLLPLPGIEPRFHGQSTHAKSQIK